MQSEMGIELTFRWLDWPANLVVMSQASQPTKKAIGGQAIINILPVLLWTESVMVVVVVAVALNQFCPSNEEFVSNIFARMRDGREREREGEYANSKSNLNTHTDSVVDNLDINISNWTLNLTHISSRWRSKSTEEEGPKRRVKQANWITHTQRD